MSENIKNQDPSDEELEIGAEEAHEEKTKKSRGQRGYSKKLKHGTLSAVYTVIFVAAVVLVNLIAGMIFKRYPITLDLTKNAKYSISDESEDYIKSIDNDVTIRVFADEDSFTALNEYTMQANEVIKRYCESNRHISAEYVDIDQNPDIVSEYADTDIASYNIVVESPSLDENGQQMLDDNGKALKRVRRISLLEFLSFSDEFEQQTEAYGISGEDYLLSYAGSENGAFALAFQWGVVKASRADQALVSALMAVTDPDPVVVSVLSGRNELADIDYLRKLLLANGYTVRDVDITSEEIPADTDMCIMPAPGEDYMEAEITKVDEFISGGGKMGGQLIYIASYGQQATPNIDELLEEYYIKIDNGIVWENDPNYYTMTGQGQVYTISDNISDRYLEDLDTDDVQILLSYSRPIKLLAGEVGRQKVEALVSSTENACIIDTATGATLENGMQVFAALSSKSGFEDSGEEGTSNILVIGSPDMVSDQFLMFNQYQNSVYMLSVADGMTGKTSNGIMIEPKIIGGNIFDITAKQIRTLKIIFIGVIPVLTLAVGLVIWLRRKNR